jgi:hypothetical protein
MNSVLGTIQLGTWELGSPSPASASVTCQGKANPKMGFAPTGGVVRRFSATLGTIELGYFQLGQVPQTPFTAGQYRCSGLGLASMRFKIPGFFGLCAGSGDPQRVASPNLGPLVAFGRGRPVRSAAGNYYYAQLDASGLGDPSRVFTPPTLVSAVGLGLPIRTLSPVAGQQVSCVVGPNPPEGQISNYVY